MELLYPGILEEANHRVPASGPLHSPTYTHRRRRYWCLGSCQSGIKMVLDPLWPNTKTADGDITSLVSCFSRHCHSAGGSGALLLSTIPSCKRTKGRTGRAPMDEAESSLARNRGEAMPIRRFGLCGSKSLGHHTMDAPRPVLCPPASIRIRSAPPEMPLSRPRVEISRGDCRPGACPVVTGLVDCKSIVAQLAGVPKLHACS